MKIMLQKCLQTAPALVVAALTCTVHAAPTAPAQIDPAAQALVQSLTAKLGPARTIRLTAKHELDPALGVGAKFEKGPIEVTVQRPNLFYALQRAGEQTREIAYDGKEICLMQPGLKNHTLEPLKAGTVEQFAEGAEKRFGFRPPLAELLSADPAKQLMLDVTSARVLGVEWVGWTRCHRLHFEQKGMTGDLWIGKKDGLPHRYMLTYTDIKGCPTWDIRLSKWELDGPVDAALFTKRPPPDSFRMKMLKTP
jgi:hypothetical protein